MKILDFKAYALTNEINLNKMATECGIPKKYTWEEPLVLLGERLGTIIKKKPLEDQRVLVFSFGSVVFINIDQAEILVFLNYLKIFEPEIEINDYHTYQEEYELKVDEDEEITLTDQYVSVPCYEDIYPELISTVIAKSVALEKTEEQLGKILDLLENIIVRLEKGLLRISDKDLARTTARIIKHEYNTIAYIMILDKPDLTWSNTSAAKFYDSMSDFFELSDRYNILKQKTEILNDIINGFSTISFSNRGMVVEWIVVILIVIEVVIMILELIR